VPEGGGCTTNHCATSNRSVEREASEDNFLQERRGGGSVSKVTAGVVEEPVFPREIVGLVKLVDEVEQQAPVLPMEILDTKATFLLRQQNLIPSN
jgi:hypothetical protein